MAQKVLHRHRIGSRVFRRVSELVFIRRQPKAILHWIDSAGVRTPIYADLDPKKLRRLRTAHSATFQYDGMTVDPADRQIITDAVQNPR
ncbi:MAG: hypothetical protein JO292_10075 [Betaproteobacteria bacterium]|nr:hypothetical protein [Betaproteobacteria bacterium]